jgi:hemolysin activation/secretion protein
MHTLTVMHKPPFRLLVATALWALASLASAAVDSPAFELYEITVDGNSVLPQPEVERAVYPFLGPDKRIADIEKAREALERAYHEAGFLTVLVDIPEQRINSGTVTLRVTEGRVERLKVAGNRYTSRKEIRADTPALAPGEVPNFTDVQQELARAQRADRKLTPLLRPGKAPGTVEVELKVDDDLPLHGSIEYNNKRSPDTTRDRLEASLRYDNLWQKGHSVGLSFQNSPKKSDEVEVWTGTYSAPLGAGTLAAYAVKSNSNMATAAESTVLGKGTTVGLRYIRPLPGRGSYFHSLTAGFDYKDFKETTNLLGSDSTNKPLRYVPLVLQYTAGLQDASGQWQFNFGTAWSLRHFSDREVLCDDGLVKDQFECKRSGARSNFAVLRGDAQRTQVLGAGWDLTARVDFQGASQPLVSNEQFSAGGVDSVRGYLDAERQGDDGVRARFELRTPGLLGDTRFDVRVIGFFDWAGLRVQEPLPQQEARFGLGSYGIGLRLRDASGLRLFVDMAHTLRNGAGAPGGGWRTAKNDTRIHMRMTYEF